MKNKIIILLLVALFLPFATAHAQELGSESTIEQLQQRIEKLEQSDTALQKRLAVVTIVFTKALYKGVTGDQVHALQEFLKQSPDIYPEGLVTGYFGPLTHNAVTRFQTKEGIPAVGMVGPITRARLNELMAVADVEIGIPGPVGETGAIGPAGPAGAIGLTGPAGPIGETGAISFAGATGAIGPVGPVGPIGDTGLPGPIGETGTTSPVGAIGLTGPVGPLGKTGPAGPAGPIGETGTTSPAGATGAIGPVGAVGPNFLTVSAVDGDINKNKTFVVVSGGTFTAGNAYCTMLIAPGAGREDTFIISVGGVMLGTCMVRDTATFGSITLTPTSIIPGTVVQINTSTTGSKRLGSVAIGQ